LNSLSFKLIKNLGEAKRNRLTLVRQSAKGILTISFLVALNEGSNV